jgi:hypothetical protein
VGEILNIANKMLSYVIHGLSTKYTIPGGYFFHGTSSSETYFKITMNILELLTSSGFIVLRIVTDNFSANVKLFKILRNGSLTNSSSFFGSNALTFEYRFLSCFEKCTKFILDREMNSSVGIISSDYLK